LLSHLKVYYSTIKALDGVSLHVPRGRIVALLGANGSGKTTTLRAITGLEKPREGHITFAGEEIQGQPTHEIIRSGIAMVPEGRRIFTNLSVYENLLLGAYFQRNQDLDRTGLYATFPRLAERRDQPRHPSGGAAMLQEP
jgi:branched-chain amino acid transport system ATP-binding protein